MEITERLWRESNATEMLGRDKEETIGILLRLKQESMRQRICQLRSRLNDCLAALYQVRMENQALLQQQNHEFLFHVEQVPRTRCQQG